MTKSPDCLFCRIAAGEIPSEKVHDDGELFVIQDINPAAPTHLLVIPHEHIATVAELEARHAELVGRVYLRARRLAEERGFAEDGYRIVSNCGSDGGQTVFHIHFHLLAGRGLGWPPG
jgi:histidine triad (HIT) family protein